MLSLWLLSLLLFSLLPLVCVTVSNGGGAHMPKFVSAFCNALASTHFLPFGGSSGGGTVRGGSGCSGGDDGDGDVVGVLASPASVLHREYTVLVLVMLMVVLELVLLLVLVVLVFLLVLWVLAHNGIRGERGGKADTP
jgi:hypothetical protein